MPIFDWMREAGYCEKRCTIKILQKDVVVDCCGHKHDFESGMPFEKVLELQKKEIAIHRTLMNLETELVD